MGSLPQVEEGLALVEEDGLPQVEEGLALVEEDGLPQVEEDGLEVSVEGRLALVEGFGESVLALEHVPITVHCQGDTLLIHAHMHLFDPLRMHPVDD